MFCLGLPLKYYSMRQGPTSGHHQGYLTGTNHVIGFWLCHCTYKSSPATNNNSNLV